MYDSPMILFYLASLLASSHALQLQLASVDGMRQEYFLGEVLRKRYVDETEFIYPNYTRVQVYVRSTDVDRTLMSAEAMLAALFPPGEDQVFNASILWQPIPVHTIPADNDTLLRAYSADCPKYRELLREDTQTQAYIDLENENKGFFKFLEENTGLEAVNLSNTHSIRDVLYIEEIKNLTLPGWVSSTVMERLLNLSLYTGSLRFNSLEKQQLTAGNWVDKVVVDMMMKKDNPKGDIKLYLYSAHDSTVQAMMTALGVFDGEPPPYAATFFIELYCDDNGEYWVSLFYRNETDSEYLWPLNVDSCSNPNLCTLDEFEKHAAPVIPEDWKKQCELSQEPSGVNTIIIAVATVCGVVLLLLIVVIAVVVVLIIRNRSYHKDESLIK